MQLPIASIEVVIAVATGGCGVGDAIQIVIGEADIVSVAIGLGLQLPISCAIGVFCQRFASYLKFCHIAEAIVAKIIALGCSAGGSGQGAQHTFGILVSHRA